MEMDDSSAFGQTATNDAQKRQETAKTPRVIHLG